MYMKRKLHREDITNKKFGRLTALYPLDIKNRTWRWICKCECGNTTIGIISKLKNGCKKSCGCKRKENIKPKYSNKHQCWTGYESISGTYWKQILSRAKLSKIKCDLTIKYIWDLYIKQNKKCAISGVNINFEEKNTAIRKHTKTASLDRIDSTKGYLKGNVQWIHKDINYMKSNHSQEYFLSLCEKIYNKNKKK